MDCTIGQRPHLIIDARGPGPERKEKKRKEKQRKAKQSKEEKRREEKRKEKKRKEKKEKKESRATPGLVGAKLLLLLLLLIYQVKQQPGPYWA